MRLALLLAVGGLLPAVHEAYPAGPCILPSQHAGLWFPVERLSAEWSCRLQPIVTDYTTANKVGPVATSFPEPVYRYLLDHPPIAAALVNRLDLGLYKAVMESADRFWGSDGEGTEGRVQLAYEDRHVRIYYLEGTHDGTLLPHVTGKAVLLLMMRPVTGPGGAESVEATVVTYLKLDNRFLSGLLSLLRPLIGRVVISRLHKAFDTAERLSHVMRHDPDRVLFEATDPPALPAADVAFLKEALRQLRHPGTSLTTTDVLP